MKVAGIIVLGIILLLLTLSMFTNVYEFDWHKEAGIVNTDGVLVLTVNYSIISTLSLFYVILNKLYRNKWIVYPIMVIGMACFFRLVYIFVNYYEG